MKLLSSIKIKKSKDENCENVPHLEITEVILVHCNIFIVIFSLVYYNIVKSFVKGYGFLCFAKIMSKKIV